MSGKSRELGAAVSAPRSRARDALALALLAGVIALLLHEALFGGRALAPADGIFSVPPWRGAGAPAVSNYLLVDQYTVLVPQAEFVHQQLAQGDFPLWNPHTACGLPNLAPMHGALLFPVNLLLAPFLAPFHALGVAAFLKLLLAGAFTYALVRELGASRSGALLSGLVFALSGFMVVWLGHPHVSSALALPLLLVCVERSLRTPLPGSHGGSIGAWLGVSVGFALTILGGHPPTAVHVSLVLGAWFVFRCATLRPQATLRRTLLFGTALIAGVLLAAPQVLPFLEYYRESSAALSSASLARASDHLTPATGIGFLLPYAFSSPVAGFEGLAESLGFGAIANFNERTGYVGIVPLALAALAVFRRRDAISLFFAGAVCLCLLVAYGVLPVAALLSSIPVLDQINHMRLLFVVGLSIAVLAGLGLDELRAGPDRAIAVPGLAFVACVSIVLLVTGVALAPRLLALAPAAQSFLLSQLPVLGCGLFVVGLVTVGRAHLGPRAVRVLCLGATALDLLAFSYGVNPTVVRPRYYPRTPAIDFLAQDSARPRFFAAGQILAPNTASVYGLNDVRGSDFMAIRSFEELIRGQAGEFGFYSMAAEMPPSLPLLAAKYVVTTGPMALPAERFEPVYSGEVTIYRDRHAVERALVVLDHAMLPASDILTRVRSGDFDPRRVILIEDEPDATPPAASPPAAEAGARIVRDAPDALEIEAQSPAPGFLLLLDTFFPGWQAEVNGQSARIQRADYTFRSVRIPAGRSRVRFRYQPRSWRAGLALSGATAALLCVWAFEARRRAGRPR